MQEVIDAPRLASRSDLRRLLLAQFAAQAADGLAQAGFADALLLEPLGAGTPTRVLAVFALTLLPYSLVAPFLGVFVDRLRRRNLLVWVSCVRAVVMLSLALWTVATDGDLVLYGAALIMLGLGRLWLTTKAAVLPVVLGEQGLLEGNSLSQGGGMVSALAGGVAGLGLVGAGGPEVAFLGAGLALCLSAGAARSLSDPMAHPHPPPASLSDELVQIAGELGAGSKAIWERRRVRLLLTAIFLLRTIGMFVAIAAILVIKREFPEVGDRAGRLSSSAFALGAAGVGAFVGSITAPWLGRRLGSSGLVVAGFVVSAFGLLALGGITNLGAVMGLTFIGGWGLFVAKVAVDAQVQADLPDEVRGRAFSLYDILYNVASVVAAVVMVTAGASRLRPALLVAGAVALLLGGLLGRALNARLDPTDPGPLA